jgi:tetratricopeptide (TPR) repeat protein
MAPTRSKKVRSGEVVFLLSQLIDKNLVILEKTPDGERYRLMETVREYLRESFGHGTEAAVSRKRHRRYFVDLATMAEPKLVTDEAEEYIAVLEQEHDNLRLANDHALHEDPNDAVLLAGALWRFWFRRGHLMEGKSRAVQALQATESMGDTLERAKVLHCFGSLSWTLGDLDEAEDAIKKSLTINEAHGDRYGTAGCMIKLGNIALDRSEFAAAREYYENSLGIYRGLGDPERISTALNNLGSVAQTLGDFDGALVAYADALEFAKQSGNASSSCYPLINIGEIHLSRCDYDEAVDVLEDVLQRAQEIGERQLVANAFVLLGAAAYSKDELPDARTLLEMGVREADSTGDLAISSDGRLRLSLVSFELGDRRIALEYLREGLTGFVKLGGREGIAKALSLAGILSSDPRLWAAADRLRRETGAALSENDRGPLDAAKERARRELGEPAFEAAWEEGEAMSADEAIAVVMR